MDDGSSTTSSKPRAKKTSQDVFENIMEEDALYLSKPQVAAVSRKKSTFNRLTEMIAKSPILEPLRSESLFLFHNRSLYLNTFACLSLPLTLVILTSFKFCSIFFPKSQDRPPRQTKLKGSLSNASDSVSATHALKALNDGGDDAKEAKKSSKSVFSSAKSNQVNSNDENFTKTVAFYGI